MRELNEQADLLLSMVTRDEYPHYSDFAFERKNRRAREREKHSEVRLAPLNEAAALLQRRTIASVVGSAGLTRRQSEVFHAKAAGHGWADIGRRFGHSKQGAHRIFCQAVAKIRRAWRLCPLAGIDEVYRAEVRRYVPRRH